MIPHDTITSAANPRVRQAALLRQADARRQTGLTLVDGRRELAKASAAGVPIVDIFLDARVIQTSSIHADSVGLDRWLNALCEKGTRIVSLSPKAFDRIAFGGRNEGCVGVVAFAAQSLERLTLSADCPVLLVEGIEKPGNLGAILRTADATGMAGVIVCDGRTDPANPAVIRASLGTVFTVPLAFASSDQVIDWCHAGGRRVAAAMPTGERLWHQAHLAGNVAILLGSEAHGISPLWQQAAALKTISFTSIRLPMVGSADSLNVSATAAVLAYEALRQGTLTD